MNNLLESELTEEIISSTDTLLAQWSLETAAGAVLDFLLHFFLNPLGIYLEGRR
jgi:hypothetical protein